MSEVRLDTPSSMEVITSLLSLHFVCKNVLQNQRVIIIILILATLYDYGITSYGRLRPLSLDILI